MNPLWLWLIVPASVWLGALCASVVWSNNNRTYINMDSFLGTLKIFADHLRKRGEIKAAEAVETILKAVTRGVFR